MALELKEIIEKINLLKKEKKAIILAHNYQPVEVHSVADMVGDSFQLSKAASEVKADIILFCGVKFMAETAKLLSPDCKVLLSAGDAGCPMADMANADDLKKYKEKNPDYLIVCYVNSSIEVKALSDVCVTSSNAVRIVNKLPLNKPIMFVPDQNLGQYVQSKTNRKIDVWDGFCPIHHVFINTTDIKKAREIYPDHVVIVHPECKPEVVEIADFVGSTKELADFTENNDKVVIGTEIGLINMLQIKYPHKSIKPLSEKAICVNMKKTSLNTVLETLQDELNQIFIPEDIAQNALIPIQKMLELN
ncbi:MAG: quinolinate synthase NadA [Candidatus Cloacimonetes bacterium]|nr:quinolinate synthase NadA [Candidatus Cloacimonadota bacterium]